MNKVILMGRLTRDPEVRYSQGATATAIARFSIAVDRRFKRDGEPDADFINCVAFGRTGEFIERYGHKGTKFVVEGRIQTGSYTQTFFLLRIPPFFLIGESVFSVLLKAIIITSYRNLSGQRRVSAPLVTET